jgi:tetratricopeptide (TPR) repeat protein/glycosyltransferase involved in cell wall biosynthesis
MKILFQTRPNAFTQRGGDTVDIERISSALSSLGMQITIDAPNAANIREFDCVFLINFTLPQLLRQQAENCKQAGVPYVVLALNEDIPSFHSQSHAAAGSLMEYTKAGQPKDQFYSFFRNPWSTAPFPRFENEWVARNAAIVFTTGEIESRVLQSYYPGLTNLCAIPLGFDTMQSGSAEAFAAEFGVKDFVLSVGRIESRKNQLMLLKALENEDLTLVIASGGFTYQPDYDYCVRNFKRQGKTIVLDKLTPTQLANAYAACKIHALPSWYELPGLVSMEAASIGKNVVVSDLGTTRNYFADDAFYADPGSPESVRNAVLAAMYSPLKDGLQNRINQFSWAQTGEHVFRALNKHIPVKSTSRELPKIKLNGPSIDLNLSDPSRTFTVPEVIQRADQLARTGEIAKALELIRSYKKDNPRNSSLWRAEGMLMIAMGKHAEAQNLLQTALSIDPQDARIVCGLGICAKQEKQVQAAHDFFVRALQLDRNNKVAILQLLGVAYDLNDFSTLESALRHFVAANNSETDMTYALAGCLYKQNKLEESQFYCREVLSQSPSHTGAAELLNLINQDLEKIENTGETLKDPQQLQEIAPLVKAVEAEIVSEKPSRENASQTSTMESMNRILDLKRNHKISQGLLECSALLGSLAINAPELEEVYSLQGELMALNGQVSEAERRFNSILVQFPNSVRAICGLGALYGEQGNWIKADEYFRKAISLNPKCDVGYAGLALSSLNSGDKEAAWHYYEKALSVNPENLRAVFGIMELGYPEARYNEIERVLKNYLELHPANLDFLYSLAGCFFAQNRLNEASQEVDKILMFSPSHSRAMELRQAIETRKAAR